jgi:hypothetical protein
MFGGYCANEIYRAAGNLRVLVLDAGAFLIPTHLQNLPPNIGLDVPAPISPSAPEARDARGLVWGIPWRSNVEFIGQAYCIGGKSLYWGGWCPRLLPSDLEDWPPTVRKYLDQNYERAERQTGVDVKTDLYKARYSNCSSNASQLSSHVLNLDDVADSDAEDSARLDPPLAVQGQSPASGLFGFDKYSSVSVLIEAVRDAASQPDSRRRLFVVPNAHVKRLKAINGVVTSIEVFVDGASKSLQIQPNCAVVLALGTIESTRLALASFPTSPDNPARELMGRNLMAHWRSNIFVRIRRSAFDPDNILPLSLETAALLVRGSAPQGKFHIQVTASAAPLSASPEVNSDAMLFSMIPDIDSLDAILANQRGEWISIGFRGMSQLIGDKTTSVPNPSGRWINLSPFDTDDFESDGHACQFNTTGTEDALADAMDAAILGLGQRSSLATTPTISKLPERLGTALAPPITRLAPCGWEPTLGVR